MPVVAPVGTGAMIVVELQLDGVAETPLKVTVLVPCEVPKFAPLIVTEAPTGPDVGLRLEMLGGVVTVKLMALLASPFTVTTTLPLVAPEGTGTRIVVAFQLVGAAAVPLNVTVLEPCAAPKFEPPIVTDVPTGPDAGLKLVMAGGTSTVNAEPLLATPPTVTTTLPVVAPDGTGTTMLVALQLVGEATAPLNVTLLVPWLAPKLEPAIVTEVPTGPEVGFKLEMPGPVETVKVTPLLARPPTVTTTLPVVAPEGTGTTIVVAFQLVGAAAVPLKVTVLEPCVAPKFEPVIVTEVPADPDVGFKLEILGHTVNAAPLLATPPTVTTTLPVVAPDGTGTTMLDTLQLVGVAAVALNPTVLVP